MTVVAASLKMLFKKRLCCWDRLLVWGARALIQVPSVVRTQSELDRVTIPGFT